MDQPNILDLLTGNAPNANALAAALARRATMEQGAGQLASVLGAPFDGMAGQFQRDALAGNRDLFSAAEARGQLGLGQAKLLQSDAQAKREAALEAAKLAEASRHNRATETQGRFVAAGDAATGFKLYDAQHGRWVSEAGGAEKVGEGAGPVNPRRYLGEYLTAAKGVLTDQQRNALLNELAVPGAQLLDQLAEINGLLSVAGKAPTPERLSDIQRLLASAIVKSNKVAGLGALSGADLDLLTKASGSVGSLTNFLGQATGLRDLQSSVRRSADRWNRDIGIAAGSYGSSPVPGSALDFNGWDAKAEEYRKRYSGESAASTAPAPAKKRPTRTVEGETREWDDQKRSWVPVGGR